MANHHVHDRFFRSFFSDPRHLRSVLETALPPEVADSLNLETVQIEPGTWIDRHEQEHLSDLAASVEVAGHGPVAGARTARVYILTEHKSWSDPAALLQLLRYMVQVWTTETRTGAARLTPIIPIVVYHRRSGSIPGSFGELFADDIPAALRRYQVTFGADILDLAERAVEDLRGDPASRAALWLMRTIHRTIDQVFAELQAVLRGAEDLLSDDEYHALFSYILHSSELSAEDLSGKIESVIHQRRIREGLLTTAEQLMKRGEELGRREGQRDMVDRGMSVADVARYTGLAVADVQNLLEDSTT